ncbi:MAG: Hsp70 family protein [Steroidobacteraceae bacterium]
MSFISIGVDFGTSNTVIAAVDRSRNTHVLDIRSRSALSRTMPSILCFRPNERSRLDPPLSSAGSDAIEDYLGRTGPARLVQSTKSFLGARSFIDTRIFAQTYTLEQLIGTLLTHCYQATGARGFIEGAPLVIGRPIKFAGPSPDDALAQSRLESAFELAGARPTAIGLEPEAAAYAFSRTARGRHVILVVDLGGGTSDFSVVELDADSSPPKIKPLAQTGIGIAGDRFDYGIVYNAVCPALGLGSSFRPESKDLPIPLWIYSSFASWHQLSMMNTPQNLRYIAEIMQSARDSHAFEGLVHVIRNDEGFSLFQAVSRVKQQLSAQSSSHLLFKAGPVTIDRVVHRTEFEEWIAADLAAITATADVCLESAGVRASDVTRVFTTGGTSLVPAVREAFARKFGAEKLIGGDEFASVAQGLALMGCPS